jgi:hypothetical protein
MLCYLHPTGNYELWNRQVNLIKPPSLQETTHDSEKYDTPGQPPQAGDRQKQKYFKIQNFPEQHV